MKDSKLIIGQIPYANLFPFFYYLQNKCDKSEYKFIQGVPSKLNKLLREGEIDMSPSSSIEYLKNKGKYLILPWFSISSAGPIKSILLFSKMPLDELGGETIAVSSDSDTSTVLLKVILKEFLAIKCTYMPVKSRSVKSILRTFPAVLHIGDTALSEAKKAGLEREPRITGKIQNSKLRTQDSSLYIYDLGELWEKHTGLPFVYALWLVRKKAVSQKSALVLKLSEELINAKNYAEKEIVSIAREAPQLTWLSEKELIEYWKTISYNFTELHLEGLRLFEKYAKKIRC